MDIHLLTTLQDYGLSEKEAKVYLTILELGTSIASTIARRSEVNRVSVYGILDEMEKWWYVTCTTIEGIKYYTVVHPEVLLKNSEIKYQSFKQAIPEFVQIMGQFEKIKQAKEKEAESYQRSPINTTSLQKKFPAVYKKFFSEHDIVMSGTNILTRWGGFGISGKFNIKQKLPIKTYIGIKILKKEKTISFKKSVEYDAIRDMFEVVDIQSDFRFKEIVEYLRVLLYKQKYAYGLEFSILTESQQGQGTWYLSVSMSIVSTMLYLLLGKIKKDFGKKYDAFVGSDIFGEIHSLSTKLVHLPTDKNAYGANNYSVLINTDKPHMYNQVTIWKKHFYAKNLDDFFGCKEKKLFDILPFDYGFFYFGTGYDANAIISMRQNFEQNIRQEKEKIFAAFKENTITENQLKEIFSDMMSLEFEQPFKEVFTILKLQILLGFKDVLQFPHHDEMIEKFIDTINTYHRFSLVTEKENKLITLLQEKFEQYKTFSDETLGIFPISSGKTWGSFGFVVKHKKSRQTLQKVFEVLEKEGHKNILLTYANWIDGNCADGVLLEKNSLL